MPHGSWRSQRVIAKAAAKQSPSSEDAAAHSSAVGVAPAQPRAALPVSVSGPAAVGLGQPSHGEAGRGAAHARGESSAHSAEQRRESDAGALVLFRPGTVGPQLVQQAGADGPAMAAITSSSTLTLDALSHALGKARGAVALCEAVGIGYVDAQFELAQEAAAKAKGPMTSTSEAYVDQRDALSTLSCFRFFDVDPRLAAWRHPQSAALLAGGHCWYAPPKGQWRSRHVSAVTPDAVLLSQGHNARPRSVALTALTATACSAERLRTYNAVDTFLATGKLVLRRELFFTDGADSSRDCTIKHRFRLYSLLREFGDAHWGKKVSSLDACKRLHVWLSDPSESEAVRCLYKAAALELRGRNRPTQAWLQCVDQAAQRDAQAQALICDERAAAAASTALPAGLGAAAAAAPGQARGGRTRRSFGSASAAAGADPAPAWQRPRRKRVGKGAKAPPPPPPEAKAPPRSEPAAALPGKTGGERRVRVGPAEGLRRQAVARVNDRLQCLEGWTPGETLGTVTARRLSELLNGSIQPPNPASHEANVTISAPAQAAMDIIWELKQVGGRHVFTAQPPPPTLSPRRPPLAL